MDIDIVSQYILSITPAVTAVASCGAALAVCVIKVKKALGKNESTNREILKSMESAEKSISTLAKANAELKQENAQLKRKLLHLEFTEEERKRGDE